MKHVRPEGIAVIDTLARFGAALGYQVTTEHRIGRSAALDLSWTAADFNDVPLFAFEVETTASAGLANNAAKVYGAPLDELVKPLFFFHLVLAGGANNERIRSARLNWGQQNYRVYRFSDPADRAKLADDILRQHRRVRKSLRVLDVAEVLSEEIWGGPQAVVRSLSLAEEIRFDTSFLYAYAVLAISNPMYISLFVGRLRTLEQAAAAGSRAPGNAASPIEHERYEGGPGDFIPGLLELAIRISAGDIDDRDGPAALEHWATSANFGHFRMIDAAFGLSREYDQWVISVAPLHYFIAATMLASCPMSLDWLILDFDSLISREIAAGVHPEALSTAVTWFAHLLSGVSSGPRFNDYSTKVDLAGMYRRLQKYSEEMNGVVTTELVEPDWGLFDPEAFAPGAETRDKVPMPGLSVLSDLVMSHLKKRPITVEQLSPETLALSALVSFDLYKFAGSDILRLIYT